MKILETKVLKADWNVLRFMHRWEDGCTVHYSTLDKIQDAQVTWGSNPACGNKEHKKQKVRRN